ncbi:MAG: hypothetical protein F6K40_34635 [Okeania sp. SIO3I5]|uniref:hypothetical protein n=1 Tax=Okeania sp. SIO3I5 TaxID=2607805 RepID=UPI0013B881BD|nr:hypothetical protein [Okeania sp. SIO3I5]NEQ41076.1 hypothetical protein [Okeania sp. SIO3I5]
MKLSTSLVDLDNVTSKVDISEFSPEEIDNMANLILTTGGIVKPIILKRTGIESCEIVTGDFEYHSTVKASEIDPEHSGMIRGFIITEEQEENIRKQQEILRGLDTPIAESPEVPIDVQESQIDLTKMFNNLRSSLTKELNSQLDQKLQPITTKLDRLNTSSPTNSQPQINNIAEEKLENIESKIDQLLPKKLPEIEDILNNQLEVIRQKITNLSKQEALSLLAKTQTALSRQIKAIDRESNQLQRVNLLTVETEAEIKQALKRVFNSTAGGTEAWKAIKYWRKPGKNLTWENLENSAKKGHQDKIQRFSDGIYKKLKEIGDIPD